MFPHSILNLAGFDIFVPTSPPTHSQACSGDVRNKLVTRLTDEQPRESEHSGQFTKDGFPKIMLLSSFLRYGPPRHTSSFVTQRPNFRYEELRLTEPSCRPNTWSLHLDHETVCRLVNILEPPLQDEKYGAIRQRLLYTSIFTSRAFISLHS